MDPIKRLTQEHRLIERAVDTVNLLREQLKKGEKIRPKKFWMITDFWNTYADIVHHGKEEQLLFPLIIEQEPSGNFAKIIDRLVAEHTQLLGFVGELRLAAQPFFRGEVEARERVVDSLGKYIELIKPHVKLEDQELFPIIPQVLSESDMKQLAKAFSRQDARTGPQVQRFYEELVDNLSKK